MPGKSVLAAAAVVEPHLPSAVTPMTFCSSHTSPTFALRHGPPEAISLFIASVAASPTPNPTVPTPGTSIVSPCLTLLQVRTPFTTVVGLCRLALMSAEKGTPNDRAMVVGLSPG
jgi:hypothetical protein